MSTSKSAAVDSAAIGAYYKQGKRERKGGSAPGGKVVPFALQGQRTGWRGH